MPYYLVHSGTTLQKADVNGNLTPLTLPEGVTVSDARPARMAMLDKVIFIANAPSRNLLVDGALNAYLAGLAAPAAAPTLARGAAGALLGVYYVAYTFAIKVGGKIIAESPLSPASAASPEMVNHKLAITNIGISNDAGVNCRRIYRSTSGGGSGASTLFWAHDIDDNTTVAYDSNETDAELDLTPVSLLDLGAAPGTTDADRIKLVTEWKDRLWAIGTDAVDNLRYSGEKMPYAWKPTNMIPIGPVGEDSDGVTGFIRRRDELGVGRRRVLWKIIGSNPDEFRRIKVVEGVGIFASASVRVIRDIGYFLAEDGVYQWGPEGVRSISDGQVRSWFTTNDVFNRALFSAAFARYDPRWNTYELHLAAAGSSVIDRWVAYDISRGIWLGPHKTDAFTPTCGGLMEDENSLHLSMLGGADGHLYRLNQPGFVDGEAAIDFDLTLRHYQNTPDVMKYWGEMSLHTKDLVPAGTLTITPSLLGPRDWATMPDVSHNLAYDRERQRRLGIGRALQLRFRENTAGQECELTGYEVDPVFELGRR